jgi:hypothetical protein
MADAYTWLRRAGIDLSGMQGTDMTKSQIREKDKMSPLGGYGYMSAKEKAARAQEQAMYEAAMQREQDMFQQQLLARMNSHQQLGHYAGAGLSGLMQAIFKGKNQPSPMMNEGPPQDDPEVARYNQLLAEGLPEDTVLEMVGNESGNGSMMADAQEQRAARLKAALETQKLQGEVDQQGKPYKVGQLTPPIPVTDAQGRPAKATYKVIGYDEETGMPKLELFKEGMSGNVNDTAEGFKTNAAGLNQRTLAFEKLMASTADGLDSYDRLEKVVKQNPTAIGWSGGWVALADNAVNGVKSLAGTLVDNNWKGDESSKKIADYDFSKVSKIAGANERIRSIILQLAYQQAAATGDSSRSLSDKDIQFQIDQIGGQITSPKNLLDLMQQNKQVLVSRLKNQSHYIKVDGKPIGSGYEKDIQGLVDRVGAPEAPSIDAKSYDGSSPPPPNADDTMLRKRLEYLQNKRKTK